WPGLWVPLEGRIVILEPLRREHEDGLRAAADDERIWRFMVTTDPEAWLRATFAEAEAGVRAPFTALVDGQPVGSTSYMSLAPEHVPAAEPPAQRRPPDREPPVRGLRAGDAHRADELERERHPAGGVPDEVERAADAQPRHCAVAREREGHAYDAEPAAVRSRERRRRRLEAFEAGRPRRGRLAEARRDGAERPPAEPADTGRSGRGDRGREPRDLLAEERRALAARRGHAAGEPGLDRLLGAAREIGAEDAVPDARRDAEM